jgi:tetratricopeptide (TPR) repeat protein
MGQAIRFYLLAMEEERHRNTESDYIHVGGLYLKNGETDQGIEWLSRALGSSRDADGTLERIYRMFKAEKDLEAFLGFAALVEKDLYRSLALDLLVAQCWIDMDRLELARGRLVQVIARERSARAHFLLSVVAERQQDWDAMELESQRATVLDPGDAGYFSQFSRALGKRGKHGAAEEAAGRAIEASGRKNPWYFNQRAWIRYGRGDAGGAVEDWKAALGLKEGHADFMFHIAGAYRKTGRFEEALEWVDKALEASPGNGKYLSWKADLAASKKQ